MQRGTVIAYEFNRGFGTIAVAGSQNIDFYVNSIVGKDRVNLKKGDAVFYEMEAVRGGAPTAINVRIAR